MNEVKDLSSGCAVAAVIHYYCPGLLRLEGTNKHSNRMLQKMTFRTWDICENKIFFLISLLDVCMKDSMSVADSLYNLQFIREFCDSCLKSCCHLALEDMLYTPQELQVLSVWITDEQKNIFTQILCYLLSAWFIFWDLDELAELPGRTA